LKGDLGETLCPGRDVVDLLDKRLIDGGLEGINLFFNRRFCFYKIDPILIWGGGREKIIRSGAAALHHFAHSSGLPLMLRGSRRP